MEVLQIILGLWENCLGLARTTLFLSVRSMSCCMQSAVY